MELKRRDTPNQFVQSYMKRLRDVAVTSVLATSHPLILTEELSRGDTSSSESGMLSNGDRFSESALSKISVRAVSSDISFWSSRDNLLCSRKKRGPPQDL